MTETLRFAPAPSGLLHIGNARLAAINWLAARHAGGRLVLRIDDTDAARSEERFAAAIDRDLAWLGLDWDDRVRQSERLSSYAAAVERLQASGRLYPCYETPDELQLKRKSLLARGLPPIYDRAALSLSADERRAYEAEGRQPHWRFRLAEGEIAWPDAVMGDLRFDAANLSDPILIREDGSLLYHLPSCVDDVELGITRIVRGEDHISNSAVQIQIIEALGGSAPGFAHLPLLLDAEGKKLSKRLGSLSLAALRDEQGVEPEAVLALLARLGSARPVEAVADPAQLVEEFDFTQFSRSAPRFDPEELDRLNAKLLHSLPLVNVADRLAALGLGDVDEPFWLAVRPNLGHLADLRDWWAVARQPLTPEIAEEDRAFLAEAADLLPPEPWDEDTWGGFVAAAKQASGRKGKALFLPLRLALTGRGQGPELAALLPLIGRGRAAARLRGEQA